MNRIGLLSLLLCSSIVFAHNTYLEPSRRENTNHANIAEILSEYAIQKGYKHTDNLERPIVISIEEYTSLIATVTLVASLLTSVVAIGIGIAAARLYNRWFWQYPIVGTPIHYV